MAQTPGINTPIDTTLKCAWYHAEALDQEDATRALRESFVAALNAWEVALDLHTQAEKAAIAPRVRVRFAETRLELAIDALYNDCKKRGNAAILAVLFADGKTAETKPRGESQRKRTEDVLLPRLRALPESSPIYAEHLPLIQGALTGLDTALKARRTAAIATAQAQADADLAREDLVTAFRSNLGAIQELWPRDPDLRDRFFLAFRSHDDGDEGNGGGGDPTT